MVLGIKDALKLPGVIIISFCAVLVCTLFMNWNMDIAAIESEIASAQVRQLYEAQVLSGKVVCALCGGCLLLTSVIMLFFYIKQHIDEHRKEIGILKAIGYSSFRIAKGFSVFGLSILFGTGCGLFVAYALMPAFYEIQNEDKILPQYSVHFHPVLLFFLVVLPALFFAVLSIIYSCRKLNAPVLELLKEKIDTVFKKEKKQTGKELPFLKELRQSTVRQRKSLVFFTGFAAFCYSSMIQMSFSMEELASIFFSVMIVLIGVILACTTLFIAVASVAHANVKTIAMMRVMGYNMKECAKAVLGGYRLVAYIGFAVGTAYQYGLLKAVITIVFKDIENVPEYNFDFPALGIALVSFIVFFEALLCWHTVRIRKKSLKEVMLGE